MTLAAMLLSAFNSVPPPVTGHLAAAVPLTPQTCNTECQRRFTDCLQDCDGDDPCMRQCILAVEQCVARCAAPSPPAPSVQPPAPSVQPPAPSVQPPAPQ